MRRRRRNSRIPGMVASPTPMVGMSGDSMSSIRQLAPSCRASRLAAIHPAVPPPTMAMRSIRPADAMITSRPCALSPSEARAHADQEAPVSGFEREGQIRELQILALIFLRQVDPFNRDGEVRRDVVAHLRIELPVLAPPD